MKTERLAVFGGSFDPPHFGHIGIAEAALEKLGVDEVLWIPNNLSPHKTEVDVQAADHRLAMTRLAVADLPDFSVSDIEVARGGISFAVDTLRTISLEHPGAELFLLIGADSYEEFDTWREPETVRKLARLVVYPRGNATRTVMRQRAEDIILSGIHFDISSSAIRSLITNGESVEGLLPNAVIDYIHAKRLYYDA